MAMVDPCSASVSHVGVTF